MTPLQQYIDASQTLVTTLINLEDEIERNDRRRTWLAYRKMVAAIDSVMDSASLILEVHIKDGGKV